MRTYINQQAANELMKKSWISKKVSKTWHTQVAGYAPVVIFIDKNNPSYFCIAENSDDVNSLQAKDKNVRVIPKTELGEILHRLTGIQEYSEGGDNYEPFAPNNFMSPDYRGDAPPYSE